MKYTILRGDALGVLKSLPSESFHMVCTSPPYWGLRDYGTATWEGGDPDCDHLAGQLVSDKSGLRNDGRDHTGPYDGEKAVSTGMPYRDMCAKCGAVRIDKQLGLEATPEEYIANMVEVFRGVWRVLRDDGTLFLNIGDSYAANRPGGQPPPTNTGNRKGYQDSGTQGITSVPPGLKPKDLCMIPARLALALQADGWWIRSEIIWAKGVSFCEHYSGSVMPESCRDRPTSAHEKLYLLTKSGDSKFWTHRDRDGVRTKPEPDYRWIHVLGEEVSEPPADWKTSRILCPECGGTREVTVQLEGDLIGETVIPCELCKGKKGSMVPEWSRINLWQGHDYYYDQEAVREKIASDSLARVKRGRAAGHKWESGPGDQTIANDMSKAVNPAGRNLRNVWTINPQGFADAHFATFPEALVRPCVKAGSSERGVCPECGAPWSRVVERGDPDDDQRAACGADSTGGYSGQATKNYAAGMAEDPSAVKARILEGMRERKTTGWRRTCSCGAEPIPATVIDIFTGSGTTGVVACKLGRSFVGIELNPEYADMAERRIEKSTKQGDMFPGVTG